MNTSRIIIPTLFLLFLSACSSKEETTAVYSGIMDATTIKVSAQTPGIVTEVRCDEGSRVSVGDTLAVIETEKLGYQLSQSQSLMEELSHQLRAAQLQQQAAAIQRDNVQTKLQRFTKLLQEGAATQQMVDDLQTQFDAANEQLRAADASLAAIRSKKMQVESGMKVTTKQMRDAFIVSPEHGAVIIKYTEKGELVTIGSPLFEIANLTEMWTKIYLSETDVHRVKLGQKVQLKVDGLPEKSFDATVTWISDKSEFTPKTILTEETRTTLVYAAKVKAKNPDGVLKIGMPVSVLVPR